MKLASFKSDSAWQPLTFRGVALFASAPLKRILLIQFLFALCTAVTVIWFLNHAWFPTVKQAILQMPDEGQIVSGKLNWTNTPPTLLAEGPFLAIIADLDHTRVIRVPAHLQVEIGASNVRFISLFGYMDWMYPVVRGNSVFDFNRHKLEPWWGAWRPPILWMVFGATLLLLMCVWWAVASLYAVPLWLISFFANRRLSLVESWKLAGASLMPAAMMMLLAILAYGSGVIDLVQLMVVQGLHWIVGVAYGCVSIRYLSRAAQHGPAKKNPFPPDHSIQTQQHSGNNQNPFKPPDK
jgi:hypothetical protein